VRLGRACQIHERPVADGFVLPGEPLEETCEVLLIVRASDAEEIHARLAADSWAAKGLLRTGRVVP